MSGQTKADHNLMEHILSILCDSDYGQTEEAPFAPTDPSKRQASLELKEFLNQMPGGFFIYHADGSEELLYVNQAILRLFNCNSIEEFKELTGNSFRGMVHPEDLEAVEASIWEQIHKSQYDLDYVEYRIIQKGGSRPS